MRDLVKLLFLVGALVACTPGTRVIEYDASIAPDARLPCNTGETHCSGNVLDICQGGLFVSSMTCPQACDARLGCVACVPFSSTCSGETVNVCRSDGSGYEASACDLLIGSRCDPGSGQCVGPCTLAALGHSYLGCEYYPTVVGNAVASIFDFAIAVANSSNEPATVTIEGGALGAAMVVTVAPASVQVVTLPWQDALKLCNSPTPEGCYTFPSRGALVTGGAYHVRSTQPVTVYQFNPLQYEKNGTFSYTNDASLLLPVNAWGRSHVVAAWQTFDVSAFGGGIWPSLFAVTAAEDDTTLTIQTRATTLASGGAPAFTSGTPGQVVLQAGDVIELAAFGTPGAFPRDDMTGSMITSDKPVQVISGTFCSNVPDDVTACDHLEESLLPIETLGTRYLVTAPAVPELPDGKEEVVRIIATQANTVLTYDPPQPGAGTTLAAAGDFIEIARQARDYLVTANEKIMVVQYMEGQEAGGNTGDPSMALSVPVDQYRSSYLFHAPTNYDLNYVNVTAPSGAIVTLDGATVSGFTAIGTTGFQVARVPLSDNVDGNHIIASAVGFGISVYGYGTNTSYWYPGGLDLTVIP